MEKQIDANSGGSWALGTTSEGGCPWVKVVQSPLRQVGWTSHEMSAVKVEQLQHYSSMALEFLKDEMQEEWRKWEKVWMLVQSLGQ